MVYWLPPSQSLAPIRALSSELSRDSDLTSKNSTS